MIDAVQNQDSIEEFLWTLVPPELRSEPGIKFAVAKYARIVRLGLNRAVMNHQAEQLQLQEAMLLVDELGISEETPATSPAPSPVLATKQTKYSAALELVLRHEPALSWFGLIHTCSVCTSKTHVSTAYCPPLKFDEITLEHALTQVLCSSCGQKSRTTPKPVEFEGWFLRLVILRLRKEGFKELAKKARALASTPAKKIVQGDKTEKAPAATSAKHPLTASLGDRLATKGPKPKEAVGGEVTIAQPSPAAGDDIPEIDPADVVEEVEVVPQQTSSPSDPSSPEDPRPVRGPKEGVIRYGKRLAAWKDRHPGAE